MVRNAGLRFICRQVHIRVENSSTPFTLAGEVGQVLKIPVAHMGGNYVCDDATLDELQCEDRILFRYTTPEGQIDEAANPNGSVAGIAGICNRQRNVAGLMPHPERAVEAALGSTDGLVIFCSMIGSIVGAARATA